MRAVLTGGGTGGHIYPAVAICEAIKKEEPESEILFMGTEHGLEKDIIPRLGYRIEFVKARGLSRKNPLKNLRTAVEYLEGYARAKKILKEFRPDVVVGTGGYVCAPVIKAASSLGISCYIHEQNAYPGLTNKLLEKDCEKVFIAFSEAAEYFKDKEKILRVGNPVRASFFEGGRREAREKLNIEQDKFVILSIGGSLGAERINKAVRALCESVRNGGDTLLAFENTELIVSSGRRYYEEMKDLAGESVAVSPYIENMDDYVKAADLVISRSGALALSELLAAGRASILVPSPNVTGNHQYHNAKSAADRGAAILIKEKELTDELLLETVAGLRADRARLEAMEREAAGMAERDAAGKIYENICKKSS